jgi:hypothetical protein
LTEQKILKLESLPDWTWLKRHDQVWEDTCSAYKEYVIINKKIPERGEIYKEFNLYSWANKQKTKKRNNKMPSDQITKLEAIHGWKWWNINE